MKTTLPRPDRARTTASRPDLRWWPALAAVLFALALSAPAARAETLACKVVGVKDGDTVDCLTTERRLYKVRLAEIDAPESRQDYGQRAKQALSAKVFGRQVHVSVQDVDRYGRVVGVIWSEGRNVNMALVAEGMAWCYRKYLRDLSCLEREDEARQRYRGLWGSPQEPVAPWEFRRQRRGGAGDGAPLQGPGSSAVLPATANTASDPRCGQKRRCGQMASCEEAQAYLQQCGLSRLDGDGDGVACDSRCQ